MPCCATNLQATSILNLTEPLLIRGVRLLGSRLQSVPSSFLVPEVC